MSRPTRDPAGDAGEAAQAASEAHVQACEAVNDEYEETGDLTVLERSPATGSYDGCLTCQIKEALAAAWPIVVADCAALVELAGHLGAAKLLQDEAARMALPHTPAHAEGVHA